MGYIDPSDHPFGFPHAGSLQEAALHVGLPVAVVRDAVAAYCTEPGDYLVPVAGPDGGCWLRRSRAESS